MSLEINIHEDLKGPMSIKFKPGNNFDQYCAKHIENYDPDRFEALAVRCYYAKEIIITVFAIDKNRQETSSAKTDKIPVRKFKMDVSFIQDILSLVEECNFTVTTGNYDLEDMEVINK